MAAAPRVLVRSVIARAAFMEGLTVERFLEGDRRRRYARPRQRAMYVAHALRPDFSYERLGLEFGGRDHSTVLHGVRKVGSEIRRDPEEQALVTELLRIAGADEITFVSEQIAEAEARLATLRGRLARLQGRGE